MEKLNELVRLANDCQSSGNPWPMINRILPRDILSIAKHVQELEQRAEAAKAKLNKVVPHGLHPSTAELVLSFAAALAEKLYRSEQKYGWSDGWKDSGWQDKCLSDFQHHITKGDPRDVAAYCAFMWHHGWDTRPAPAISLAALVPGEITKSLASIANEYQTTPQNAIFIVVGWNACRTATLRNIEEANGQAIPAAKVDSVADTEVQAGSEASGEENSA